MTATLLGVALTLMTCAAGFLYLLWSDANDDVESLDDLILYLDGECSGSGMSDDGYDALREQANEIREFADEQKEKGDE